MCEIDGRRDKTRFSGQGYDVWVQVFLSSTVTAED